VGVVAKKEPKGPLRVGDKIRVSMHDGKIVDAVIKAILNDDRGGLHYQIDFGHAHTALILVSK
jgi:hypothetical protein